MSGLFRVSGAGNDFLALVEPPAAPTAERIRSWCRRGVSLGADGVFVLAREEQADAVEMAYFNADGGRAELCLNGTRCAAQLAFHLGWAEREVRIRTDAGTVRGRRLSAGEVEVEAPLPGAPLRPVELPLPGDPAEVLRGWALVVGVPHAVIAWDTDLAGCPVPRLGPPVRHHPTFPSGANANFVRYTGRDRLEIRTWERGVEAETLACGTGVLAAVACGVATLQLALPATALTAGGFALTVDGEAVEGVIRRWTLAGDARVLAQLQTLPGAELALPEPPAWT